MELLKKFCKEIECPAQTKLINGKDIDDHCMGICRAYEFFKYLQENGHTIMVGI